MQLSDERHLKIQDSRSIYQNNTGSLHEAHFQHQF